MLKRATSHNQITLIRHGCLVLLLLLILLPAQALAANSIKWYSYDEGRILGKVENKKMFVHFWAEWCAYCLKMEKETFADAAVAKYLNANFIPIKVNTERERDIAAQYNIRPIPDNWFLVSNGNSISNQPGFIQADMFIKILEYIHTDSYLDTSFMNFLQRGK